MKITLYLAVALVAVTAIALLQWRGAAVQRTECRAAAEQARAEGRAAAMKHRLDIVDALAAQKLEDDAELRDLRRAIDKREVEVRTVYRDRIREVPVPECRVAPAQVEAINEVLLR